LAVWFCVEFFYLSQLPRGKQKTRNRMNVYSVGTWLILPIPVWAAVHQAMIHYPRPFLYGMQYMAFMAVYFVLAAVISLALWLFGRLA